MANSGLFGRLGAFFIAFVLAFATFNALAATYYVASSGNDTTGNGSLSTPYATPSKAYAEASSGDTILLNRGDTWVIATTITVSKTSLTFDAYGSGALPRWSGSNWTEPGLIYAPFIKVGTDEGNTSGNGLTVRNQEFYRGSGMSIDIYSDNFLIEDNTITSPGSHCVIARPFASNGVIRGNTCTGDNYGYGNRDDSPFVEQNLTAWGSGLVNRGDGNIIEGNYVYDGWGEGINVNCGARDFIVRDNRVEGGKVGIYNDVVQNGEVYNNIVVRDAGSTSNGSGIALNIEPWCQSQASSRGLGTTTQNIKIYNNLVAAYPTACLWGADELGSGTAQLSYIYVYNNTFSDCTTGIRLTAGDWDQSWFKNNVVHIPTGTPAEANMITLGGNITGSPAFAYNYFTVAPPGGAGATNSTLGSSTPVDLVKTSGWSTSANGEIVAGDFAQDSTSLTGTTTLGNGITYTAGYYGNAASSPPLLGAIQGADIGSDKIIESVNGGTNTVGASQAHSFAGQNLYGCYAGDVHDGVDSDPLSNVLSQLDGLSGVFDTGSLASIDNPSTLKLTCATPTFAEFTPSSWVTGSNTATVTVGLADAWMFQDGITIARASGTGNTAVSDTTFTANAGDVIDAYYYIAADTSGKARLSLKNQTTGNFVTRTGTIGSNSYASGSTTAASGAVTTTETATGKDGVVLVGIHFTTANAGTWRPEVGSEGSTNGEAVKFYGTLVWVNRSGSDVEKVLENPFVADIDDLNTDNVIDPISAANGSNLFALSGNIGGVSIPFMTPNVSGSVATFKSPDLSGLANGNQTLTLDVAQPAEINQSPTSWPTNTATALVTSYTGTHLGYGGGAKLTVGTGGADWGGFKVDDLVTVAAGDVIEQWVDVVQSTGGQVRVSLTNQTAGGYVDYKGIFGALSSSAQTACSSSTLSETAQDGMTRIKILCTSAAAGAYRLAITTNSSATGDAVIVLGRTTYVNASPIAKTLTVTNPGGIVPEPELVKKIAFRFADGNDTSLACRSAQAGQASQYNSADEGSGDIYIVIGSGNPRAAPATPFPSVLAYDLDATIVNGEYDLDETKLEYGSINALETGDQGYYMWASNASGSCRWSAPVQVIAE